MKVNWICGTVSVPWDILGILILTKFIRIHVLWRKYSTEARSKQKKRVKLTTRPALICNLTVRTQYIFHKLYFHLHQDLVSLSNGSENSNSFSVDLDLYCYPSPDSLNIAVNVYWKYAFWFWKDCYVSSKWMWHCRSEV